MLLSHNKFYREFYREFLTINSIEICISIVINLKDMGKNKREYTCLNKDKIKTKLQEVVCAV